MSRVPSESSCKAVPKHLARCLEHGGFSGSCGVSPVMWSAGTLQGVRVSHCFIKQRNKQLVPPQMESESTPMQDLLTLSSDALENESDSLLRNCL